MHSYCRLLALTIQVLTADIKLVLASLMHIPCCFGVSKTTALGWHLRWGTTRERRYTFVLLYRPPLRTTVLLYIVCRATAQDLQHWSKNRGWHLSYALTRSSSSSSCFLSSMAPSTLAFVSSFLPLLAAWVIVYAGTASALLSCSPAQDTSRSGVLTRHFLFFKVRYKLVFFLSNPVGRRRASYDMMTNAHDFAERYNK